MLLLTLTTLAVEQPQCTVGGLFSDCFATGCCADPTLACYKRLAPSKNHAECLPRQTTCINSEEWLCPGWEHCSERGEACMSSRCCKDSSHQCYQKNEHFAQCLPKGECLGLKDADTNVPWLCSVLREPAFCSDNWAECTSSKCCNDPAYTCYEKNAGFSKCMRTCPDPASSETFTCALHDREQRDKAAFIATLPKSTTCSGKHEECTVGGCCADEGFHCYDKGPHFAMCLREIECATFWSDHPDCKIREIPKDCSAAGHDCSKNHCCTDLAYTCFQKDAVVRACPLHRHPCPVLPLPPLSPRLSLLPRNPTLVRVRPLDVCGNHNSRTWPGACAGAPAPGLAASRAGSAIG